MTSQDFTEWATAKGIALRFIEPGVPNHNAYIERFNRTYRKEVLDSYLFRSIEQMQHIPEEWRVEYNEQRPDDALGGPPPRRLMPRITTAADSSSVMSGSFRNLGPIRVARSWPGGDVSASPSQRPHRDDLRSSRQTRSQACRSTAYA